MLRNYGFATILLLIAWGGPALTAEYTGPRPPKPDVPYLVHADNLVETETKEANQQERRNGIAYLIEGAQSLARTPLAEPIFILAGEQTTAEKMELYPMEVKHAHRELFFPEKAKDAPRPLRLSVERIEKGLYQIEVQETLENGEYCLTPRGSNNSYCFEVY